jgi:hypothetical protein
VRENKTRRKTEQAAQDFLAAFLLTIIKAHTARIENVTL